MSKTAHGKIQNGPQLHPKRPTHMSKTSVAMLSINVTITNRPKSQLKQKVKILWAVFTEPWAVLDICEGRFGCSCRPFLT